MRASRLNTLQRLTLRTLFALAIASSAGAAGASGQQRPDSASVVATRRELRIVYPRDTATRWGWDRGEESWRAYGWTLRSDAIDRSHSLALIVTVEGDSARTFASLAAVLAEASVVRCDNQGMIEICAAPVIGAAHVERGRVVLAVRDSALIADLLGLRPLSVRLSRDGVSGTVSWEDSVRVQYAEPAIALPSDSLRASVAAARRRAAKNSHWVTRKIGAARAISVGDTSWVTLGDTIDFQVFEERCSGDVCSGSVLLPDSAAVWTVSDTTVLGAVASLAPEPLEVTSYASGWFRRVAKRPGIATLRVRGLDPYGGDTALVRAPPPDSLVAVVVVRRKAARVVIHPRPDTIRVGAEPFFSADAFDEAGALIPHAPIVFTYPDSALRVDRRAWQERWDPLPPNGHRRIIATVRGNADTLTVFVADSLRP